MGLLLDAWGERAIQNDESITQLLIVAQAL